MVLQHERQSNVPSLDDFKALINAARYGKSSSSNGSKSTRICSFCGKDNHTVENCFKNCQMEILLLHNILVLLSFLLILLFQMSFMCLNFPSI
jgi:hypothetical protein